MAAPTTVRYAAFESTQRSCAALLLASEGWARSLSLDLLGQLKGFEKNGQFRYTPPTHAVLAFDQALREGACGGHCHLLPEHRAHRDLDRRQGEDLLPETVCCRRGRRYDWRRTVGSAIDSTKAVSPPYGPANTTASTKLTGNVTVNGTMTRADMAAAQALSRLRDSFGQSA